jgi:hypothetical protein
VGFYAGEPQPLVAGRGYTVSHTNCQTRGRQRSPTTCERRDWQSRFG